jgi:proteasome lid subunit RPN8/RPN11
VDPVNPPGAIRLTADQWEEMRSAVAVADPEEGCGILGGTGETIHRVFPVENVLHNSARFEANPFELLDAIHSLLAEGLDLVAIYHSHPVGPSHPSLTDIQGWGYPNTVQLIWHRMDGEWACAAFQVREGNFMEIPLLRAGGQ